LLKTITQLLQQLHYNEKQEIEFRDPVVKRVVNKFVSRSDVGYSKYGITLDKDPSEMFEWLNHLQEELMDAVLYLQKAKEVYSTDIQEDLLSELEVVDEEVF
jgi:hypothetical protein